MTSRKPTTCRQVGPCDSAAKCMCGESFAQDPAHSLNCKRLKGRSVTQRHDSAVQAYAAWVRQEGGSCVTIQPRESWSSLKKYDAFTVIGAFRSAVDFVITNAGASYVSNSSKQQGWAGAQAADRKRKKYGAMAKEKGVDLAPISIEALGHWDRAAVKHVEKAAKLLCKAGGAFSYSDIRRGMIEDISVAVARGVGDVVLEGQQLSWAATGPPDL